MQMDRVELIYEISSRLAEKEKIYALGLKMNKDYHTLNRIREEIRRLQAELQALMDGSK